jgi:hypothetical protein
MSRKENEKSNFLNLSGDIFVYENKSLFAILTQIDKSAVWQNAGFLSSFF